MAIEKEDPQHLEEARPNDCLPDKQLEDYERAPEARGRESGDVPASYWLSFNFIGSMAAIGLGFCAATGGYQLVAPVLTDINNDLGPSVRLIIPAEHSSEC